MQSLWMLLASVFFASMGVCVKLGAGYFTPYELVFYRGVVGLIIIGILARHQGVSLRTSCLGMHLWRSCVGVAALTAWFYAFAHLPLATAMTLNYTSSVWLTAFLMGGAMMQWPPRHNRLPWQQGPLALTVMVGFVGVLLLLRPTLDQEQLFAGVIGLMAGFFSAFAYMQVMALGRAGEPETRIVFYFAGGTTVAGLMGMALTGLSPWQWSNAIWLLPVGVFASLGQLCMTRAYSQGATLVVANLQYTGIVFAALYGIVLFDEALPWIGWMGMGLIIASGMIATLLRARALPRAPAEDH